MRSKLITAVGLLIVGFFAVTAAAQVELSPGVARISLIHGDVSTQRGDSGDWSVAALNAPIVSGDRISIGERSRVELQLDHANILRLDSGTQAHIATLSRTQIQVQVSRGLADYVVFKDSEAEAEINTPNVAIRPNLREGVYRIEVNAYGETRVIVRKGEAEISTPQGSTRVRKGEVATVRGSEGDTVYQIADAPSKDAWDSWNSDRDHIIQDARGWRYTNRYYVGSEDLDAYGRWITVPEYGPVWAPAVAVGWAPYRLGRWIWEPYWGWTWVSYEPWGWAPYHYGRWFVWAGSWVWWPGPIHRHYRPIWAPAYVSFFGFGGRGIGVSVGFGSVGWLPIGPCDRFYPWYGRYRSHFNVVNITNINITRINVRGRGFDGFAPLRHGDRHSNLRLALHDNRIRDGISTIPSEHFGTGRVGPQRADRDVVRNAQVMTGNLPIVPTRATLSPTNRPPREVPVREGRERFYTKSRPVAAPESFERQAAQVEEGIHRNGRFNPIRADGQREAESVRGNENPHPSQNRAWVGHPAEQARPDNVPAQNRVPDAQRAAQHDPVARPTPENRPDRADNRPGRNPRVPAEDEARGARGNRGEQAEAPAASDSPRGVNPEARSKDWRRFGDMAENQAGQKQNPPAAQERPRQTPTAPADKRTAEPQRPNREDRPAGGWRKFSDPETRRNRPETEARPSPNAGSAERNQEARPAPATVPDRSAGRESRETSGPEWRRFPAGSPERSSDSNAREKRAPVEREAPRANRPPLDLRQPVVVPRGSRPEASRGEGSRPSGGTRAEPNRGGGQGSRSGDSAGKARARSKDRP